MRGINLRDDLGWSAVAFMPSGGGGTTTSTQTSDPWWGQQDSLLNIYNESKRLYQDAVPQYYPDSTYQPMTADQKAIGSGIMSYGVGGGNTGLQSANNTLTSTLSPGYRAGTAGAFSTGQNTLDQMASGNYGNVASPAIGTGAGALTDIAGGNYRSAASPVFDKAQGVLANELDPSYLNPWNSPSFGTVVNNTLASVIPATSASFINGGRADSGLAQRATTMAATDAVGGLAQNQYQANQAIQNAAIGQASQNNQAATQNAINAAQGAGSLYGTIGGLQQGAATTGTGNYLKQGDQQISAAGVAPLVDQTQMSDLSTALQTAGLSQADAQNIINANIAKYNYGQMLPWNQLGLYENAVTGTGSPGGTTTTAQPYYNNTGANVMAGVGTAASVAMAAAAIA
jgi:hypothetical protein